MDHFEPPRRSIKPLAGHPTTTRRKARSIPETMYAVLPLPNQTPFGLAKARLNPAVPKDELIQPDPLFSRILRPKPSETCVTPRTNTSEVERPPTAVGLDA